MTAPVSPSVEFRELVAATVVAQDELGWRVWTTDLLTNRALCFQLPAAIAKYTIKVNTFGDAEIVVSLDARSDPMMLTEARRTCLWISYRGELLWGGIIWEREPDLAARTVRVRAQTWQSYFWRRLIRETLSYPDSDQFDIYRGLVDYAQAQPSGDIGVTVSSGTSGVKRRRYYGPGAGEEASPDKKVGEAMAQLAEVEGGFEAADSWSLSSTGVPEKLIVLGYPRVGSAYAPGRMYEYPGKIVTYTWPTFGDSPNVYMAVGAGEGAYMLTASAENTTELTLGYPLLEESSAGEYKDVVRRDTLQAHATEDLAAFTGGRFAPTFTLALPGDVAADLPGVGDEIRVRLTSAVHRERPDGSPGVDRRLRVTAVDVTPPLPGQDGRAVLSTVGA